MNLKEIINAIHQLDEKLEGYVQKNNKLKRKLEIEISRIRETSNEVADRLDIILKEWGEI